MKPNTKIVLSIFIWLVLTAGLFFYAIPKMSKSLTDLRQGHKEQLDALNKLKAQAASLERMRQDLDSQKKQKVLPSDLFSDDLNLVNEIKQMEDNAAKSNVKTTLAISESADKAKPLVGSLSGLVVIPYNLKVAGDFPSFVQFVKYMENSFFVSPFSGMNITVGKETGMESQLGGSFFIKKPQK